MKRRAFTLIELLIVVAIIAILAAIAVPNFLEAQTRSKVSRVKSDMRTMTTGIESYFVDFNVYPACHRFGISLRDSPSEPLVLERLSTPISYLTSVTFNDPFIFKTRIQNSDSQGMATNPDVVNIDPAFDTVAKASTLIYQSFSPYGRWQTTMDGFNGAFEFKGTAYILHSVGPDGNYYNLGGVLANDDISQLPFTMALMYDPTNGTISRGSIWRAGGESGPGPNYAGGESLLAAIAASGD